VRITPRQLIVGVEAALAVLLLSCAGLLIAGGAVSMPRLLASIAHLLTFLIRPSEVAYPAPKPALIERVLADRRCRSRAASVDGCAPVGTGCAAVPSTSWDVRHKAKRATRAASPCRRNTSRARRPLLRGRVFSSSDRWSNACDNH
jgi:hypothetical protein